MELYHLKLTLYILKKLSTLNLFIIKKLQLYNNK